MLAVERRPAERGAVVAAAVLLLLRLLLPCELHDTEEEKGANHASQRHRVEERTAHVGDE